MIEKYNPSSQYKYYQFFSSHRPPPPDGPCSLSFTGGETFLDKAKT